ncbi:hypothetical protein ACFCX4_02995 [Kitasatospora sp. NPDC056327]|uniref:hypothetical protein n=1 Tax=Kitasatospora sp. NPDC056327 TaxID=3345785 RepID=UPI0035DFC70C
MSTSTLTGPDAPVPAPSSATAPARTRSARRPRGVLWLALRQSRVPLRNLAVLALLAAVALVVLHVLLRDRLELLRQTGCYTPQAWSEPDCWMRYTQVSVLSDAFTNVAQPALTFAPVLIGMFVGGPLLAQEHERGTLRLVLAQSVSPGRWLTARLAVFAVAVVPVSVVLAALTSWVWWSDILDEPGAFDPPFQGFTYPVIGVVPVGWWLFALVLGTLVGQVVRHTVPAVVVSGALIGLTHGAMSVIRPYFWPVVEEEQPYSTVLNGFVKPVNSWLVDNGVVLADGRRLGHSDCLSEADGCLTAPTAWGEYHPPAHLVPIQLVETGLLLLLTAGLTFLLFRRFTRAGV